MTPTVARIELLRTGDCIAHEWRETRAGRSMAVHNPAKGEIVAQVPASDAGDAQDDHMRTRYLCHGGLA